MCGIMGAVLQRPAVGIIEAGLSQLTYRGYDSSGIATLDNQTITCLKKPGKLSVLSDNLARTPMPGNIGIGHTRWATHGKPTEANAHPHISGPIVLVHNGVIENDHFLRQELRQQGINLKSQTDSEVIAHLIHLALQTTSNTALAIRQTCQRLQGSYALVVMNTQDPNHLYAIKHQSPLVIGIGIEEHFVASDILALCGLTAQYQFLEEDDLAILTHGQCQIFDTSGHRVDRPISTVQAENLSSDKGAYRHHMMKEIHQQPEVIAKTYEHLKQSKTLQALVELMASDQISRCQIVACGTSYHAGLMAKSWLEWAGLPVDVEVASEFRYRQPLVLPNTVLLTISQSGETADTLAVLKQAHNLGFSYTATLCNVTTSQMVQHADFALITQAGPEIGVASTKSFTTALTALYQLALELATLKGVHTKDILAKHDLMLRHLPNHIQENLSLYEPINTMAIQFSDKAHSLFLGRGIYYPVALEGALKLKEISYIHADAYPAGELKHGPLALVDAQMPIISIVPNNPLLGKMLANLAEVKARGGVFFSLTDIPNPSQIPGQSVVAQHTNAMNSPFIYSVLLQLVAYAIADHKGTDIDQPRNLAKSVTVE